MLFEKSRTTATTSAPCKIHLRELVQWSILSSNWKLPGHLVIGSGNISTVERRKILVTNPLQVGTSHSRRERSNLFNRSSHSQNEIARLPFVSRFSLVGFKPAALRAPPVSDRIFCNFQGESDVTISSSFCWEMVNAGSLLPLYARIRQWDSAICIRVWHTFYADQFLTTRVTFLLYDFLSFLFYLKRILIWYRVLEGMVGRFFL